MSDRSGADDNPLSPFVSILPVSHPSGTLYQCPHLSEPHFLSGGLKGTTSNNDISVDPRDLRALGRIMGIKIYFTSLASFKDYSCRFV